MLGNNASVLADHNAVGVGMNLNRASDGAGRDRVLVVVEAHQAGLGDRCRHRVESVEPAGIGNELRPLGFEHLYNVVDLLPCQQSVEFCCPSSQLRPWLDYTLVLE